jgi:hypothetical protein
MSSGPGRVHSISICHGSTTNGIFEGIFNLNASSAVLLIPSLEFRKKVNLIRRALDLQGVNYGKAFQKVNELADIRNVITHSSFSHVRAYNRLKAGIEFSYLKDGEFPLINEERKQLEKRKRKSTRKRANRSTRSDERKQQFLDQQTITYSQFDKYEASAKELVLALCGIGFEPINDGIPFVREISGKNVIRFPSVRRT